MSKQENRGLIARGAKDAETIKAEISRTTKMALNAYSGVAEAVDITSAITSNRTRTTLRTQSSPAITYTKKDHNTTVKVKTLHTAVAASSVAEVTVAAVVVAATVTGKKQDRFKKLSLAATKKSSM